MRAFTSDVVPTGAVTLALVSICLFSCLPAPLERRSIAGGELAVMRAEEDIQSVHDPEFVLADEATPVMRSGEQVLGFEVDATPIAIALRLLDDHEIVNGALDPSRTFAAAW